MDYVTTWKTLKMKCSVKNKNKRQTVYLYSTTIEQKRSMTFQLVQPTSSWASCTVALPLAWLPITTLTFPLILKPPKYAVSSESLHGLFPLPAGPLLCGPHGPAWLTPSPSPARPWQTQPPPSPLALPIPLIRFAFPTVLITTQQALRFICVFAYCLSPSNWKVNSPRSGVCFLQVLF